VHEAIRRFWADTTQRYNFMRHDRERPLLPPAALFLLEEQFFAGAKPPGPSPHRRPATCRRAAPALPWNG
ncbi:hypothetical protein AB4142_36565, partial [Variovorax sp. 2RAF20]